MISLLRRSFILSSVACLAAKASYSSEAIPANDLDTAFNSMGIHEIMAFTGTFTEEVRRQAFLSGDSMWGGIATALAHSAIPAKHRQRALDGKDFDFRSLRFATTLHNTMLIEADDRLTEMERRGCRSWLQRLPEWQAGTPASLQSPTTREQHNHPEMLVVNVLELLRFGGEDLPRQVFTNTVDWNSLLESEKNRTPAKRLLGTEPMEWGA